MSLEFSVLLELPAGSPLDVRSCLSWSCLKGAGIGANKGRWRSLLNGWFGEIIPVDAGVSRVAVRLMQQFGLWHRPGMADLLIAASALETGEALATSNFQAFSFRPRARDQALQGT